jgi:hypothetical protein
MSVRRAWSSLRHLACVHTFDVVGRDLEGVVFLLHPTLVLLRVTALDTALASAAGQSQLRLVRWLSRFAVVDRLLARRRQRRHQARFAKGDVAYVALDGDEIAAWAWVSQQRQVRCSWSGLRFTLAPREAYLYDLWSYPEHRTAGAGRFVMAGLMRDLADNHGVTRVYGYVLRGNRVSQVLHRLVLGFEQVQQVRDLRVLSTWAWQLPWTISPKEGPLSRSAHRPPWRPLGPPAVPERQRP